MPSTAILLAVYNGAQYIEEMLDSLERQTDRNWVCYIHDDGSTDDTMEIVRAWIGRHTAGIREDNHEGNAGGGRHAADVSDGGDAAEAQDGGRWRILEGCAAGGAKENFFYMLRSVEADYYMFADQDDVWLPDKIRQTRRRMHSLEHNGRPAAVFTDMYVTDANLNVTASSFIRHIGRDPHRIRYQQILIDNPAAGCTMMINRSLRDIAISPLCDVREPWEAHRRLADIRMHDGWCLEIAAIYGDIGVIDRPLVYYRQHAVSETAAANEMGAVYESRLDKLRRNVGDLMSGRFAAAKRGFHHRIRAEAAELLKLSDMPREPERTLTELTHIAEHKKLFRMAWYRRHGFERAQHSFWMLLWV